jgi:LysM repeat protein
MLKLEIPQYYTVREGQRIKDIANAFCVSERLLIQENHLEKEVQKGQVLHIPQERGNLYTVREGDTKSLLCGSEEEYERRNGTTIFYLGMKVLL